MLKKKQEKVLESLTLAFKLTHLWEHFLEQYFKNTNITIKQYLLLITVRDKFKDTPAISEVAGEMESSHQNIKQIALHLKRKGLLSIKKDNADKRFLRLELTSDGHGFVDAHLGELMKIFAKIFKKEKTKDIKKFNAMLEGLINQSKKRLDKVMEQ